jgi:hypothetical protein
MIMKNIIFWDTTPCSFRLKRLGLHNCLIKNWINLKLFLNLFYREMTFRNKFSLNVSSVKILKISENKYDKILSGDEYVSI